ncbi:MAG: hypothetical protein R2818_03595 [Flavobacteriales bacterium]
MSGHGTLRFPFPNILLPDSNVNELASHGRTFRIKARSPVLPGTNDHYHRNIYFRLQPAISTLRHGGGGVQHRGEWTSRC